MTTVHIRVVVLCGSKVIVMSVMSREKLLFWDPRCTSRGLLRAYMMSVLKDRPLVTYFYVVK